MAFRWLRVLGDQFRSVSLRAFSVTRDWYCRCPCETAAAFDAPRQKLRYDARMVLTAEQQAVAETNEAFYEALTQRDLTAMERLWFPADWVECVHPGMASIRGWDAVRESWAMLFGAPGTLLVAATDVHVRLVGDVAWVSCAERIATRSDGRMASSLAHATNIFVRHDGAWRLAVHHASAVPFIALPEADVTTVN